MSISTESSSRTAPAIDWPTARSFVSGFLLRRMARPEPLGVERHALNGALLVSDVESFTAQVERLVSTGPEGLEQVISSFNRYFCAVAGTVAQLGEDILDTTGDSFLCFWAAEDDRELADATALAAQVALAVLQTTGDPSNPTIWPTRIGLAAGPVEVGIVGGVRSRWHVTPAARPPPTSSGASVMPPPDPSWCRQTPPRWSNTGRSSATRATVGLSCKESSSRHSHPSTQTPRRTTSRPCVPTR